MFEFKKNRQKEVISVNVDKIVVDELLSNVDNRSELVNYSMLALLEARKEKSKKELLASLKLQDMKKFKFNIYLLHNGTYTNTIAGNEPERYKELLYVTDEDTTIGSIESVINRNIDSL